MFSMVLPEMNAKSSLDNFESILIQLNYLKVTSMFSFV